MSDEKESPSEPAETKPPTFGSVPDKHEGLATGLGVAQPFAVDQPEPKSGQLAGENKEGDGES